jgi:predicted Zn-dependent protease
MPADSTIELWGEIDSEERPGFAGRYAQARERCLRRLADEALAIADKPCLFNGIPDNALVQQARLQIDTRKWYLSKLLPRQFGDKVTQELTGDPDRPLVTMIQLVPVAPKRLPKPDGDE